ncbi:MAG: flagellar basal body P-ring formation chaperone FlgA [Planctomycetota bacterium]|nr:flagellar basal body P-ring formation chaperone FlgA [Planctomycetota bacterium]
MTTRHTIVFTLAFAAALTAHVRGDSIRLKASVRQPGAAQVIRLADIAVLEGPEAARFAMLVVAEVSRPPTLIEIPVDQVRAVLDKAGAHWGRINLSGRTTLVRPRPRMAAGPLAMSPASIDGAPTPREGTRARERDEHTASAILDEPTLRGAIAREMVHGLGARPDALRLAFDVTDRADLDRPETSNRFEIIHQESLANDHVSFNIRIWPAHGPPESRRLTVRPLVRAAAAVLRRDLARDETITADDYEVREQWLPPASARQLSSPEWANGRVVTRRLRAGAVLKRDQVRAPTLIERGDRVAVRCLVGGMVITLRAEARTAGARGDTIEMRKLGERATFTATVTGRGEAIVDLAQHRPPAADQTPVVLERPTGAGASP